LTPRYRPSPPPDFDTLRRFANNRACMYGRSSLSYPGAHGPQACHRRDRHKPYCHCVGTFGATAKLSLVWATADLRSKHGTLPLVTRIDIAAVSLLTHAQARPPVGADLWRITNRRDATMSMLSQQSNEREFAGCSRRLRESAQGRRCRQAHRALPPGQRWCRSLIGLAAALAGHRSPSTQS
jgi:hypothetical protein